MKAARKARAPRSKPTICLISLGCAKNTVDSECLLGEFIQRGFLIAEQPADADLCLVNTCGFIAEAREETAGVLREVGRLRQHGILQGVFALGCLAERVAKVPELASFLEQADRRVMFAEYPRLPDLCIGFLQGVEAQPAPDGAARPSFLRFLEMPRARIGSPHTAYLKISEGCSNGCRFCCIPMIRGRQASRPMEVVVREAESLIAAGAREINLIAQDTTSYGRDLYGGYKLAELLRQLAGVGANAWFRLMYAFPRHLGDNILECLAGDLRFCPYIDLPLQHISDPVLRAMGRGFSKDQTIQLLERIARHLPEGVVRTAFIVGFPGETVAQFNELLAFVGEGRFAHVGVFTYSPEAGTPAARDADPVPREVKDARRGALMEAQLAVSRRRQRRRIGRQATVMLDGPAPRQARLPEGVWAVGRSQLEAPEVDGVIYLRGRKPKGIEPGDRVDAVITGALDYDAVAEPRP
jgi:ribosomal protein S12 methylthiotransferase